MGKTKICKWHIISEGYTHFLVGYIYNHPLIKDGTFVKTSRLYKINFEKGIVQTKSREYKLENF